MNIILHDEVTIFISSLEISAAAKVFRTIDLLERFGHNLSMPHSKKMQKDLFELRVRGKHEIRFFYTFHQHAIILLHGFIKKSQKTPPKELAHAVKRLSALT